MDNNDDVKNQQDDSGGQDDELELLKKQNEILRARLEELARGDSDKKTDVVDSDKGDTFEPIKFVSEEGFDGMTFVSDPKNLNELSNRVLRAALSKAKEEGIKTITQAVYQLVPQYVHMAIESERFFSENPELAKVRDYTSTVFNEIRANFPKMTLKEQLEKTKNEVYNRLSISPVKKTKIAGDSGDARKPSPTDTGKSETQKEIDEILGVMA